MLISSLLDTIIIRGIHNEITLQVYMCVKDFNIQKWPNDHKDGNNFARGINKL